MKLLIRMSNVPGVKGELWGTRFKTVDEAFELLKTERAVVEADQGGSITVYIDDNGATRAEMHFHREAVSSFTGTTAELRSWLNTWFPIMRGQRRSIA